MVDHGFLPSWWSLKTSTWGRKGGSSVDREHRDTAWHAKNLLDRPSNDPEAERLRLRYHRRQAQFTWAVIAGMAVGFAQVLV
jgi:hypothetical protein